MKLVALLEDRRGAPIAGDRPTRSTFRKHTGLCYVKNINLQGKNTIAPDPPLLYSYPALRKPSRFAQTAVSVSLPKSLLRQIDQRADSLGIPRSQYLAMLARRDIVTGGAFFLPATDKAKPPKQIDLNAEVVEFLKIAIPALTDHEAVLQRNPADTSTLGIDVPDSLAAKEFWMDVWDELKEILEYKWLQSEKLGFDIGMERAIREWLQKYHTLWASAQGD
jgi:hypothetical protein